MGGERELYRTIDLTKESCEKKEERNSKSKIMLSMNESIMTRTRTRTYS